MRILVSVLWLCCLTGVLQAAPLRQDVTPLLGHWMSDQPAITFDISSDQTISNFTADLPFVSGSCSVQFDAPPVIIEADGAYRIDIANTDGTDIFIGSFVWHFDTESTLTGTYTAALCGNTVSFVDADKPWSATWMDGGSNESPSPNIAATTASPEATASPIPLPTATPEPQTSLPTMPLTTITVSNIAELQDVGTVTVTGYIEDMDFSPDGNVLAGALYPSQIWKWDRDSNKITITDLHIPEEYGGIIEVAFQPDGTLLAFTKMYEDPMVRVWNIDGALLSELQGLRRQPETVALSPDGMQIAAGDLLGTVLVWDLHSTEETNRFSALSHVASLAFSPDGRILAAGDWDAHSIELWQFSNRESIMQLTDHPFWVQALAYSPDGGQLAAVSDTVVQVWEVTSGTLVWSLDGHYQANDAVFSPDGNLIATGDSWEDSSIRIWDASTGELLTALLANTLVAEPEDINVSQVLFAPDGTLLIAAISTPDGQILKLFGVPEH